MDLSRQYEEWEELASLDPYWAILTEPGKKFGKWNLAEFFLSGQREIEIVMSKAKALNLPRRRIQALDFGCGVGRLTRALATHFETVYGVDISEIMVAKAQELNSTHPKCKFVANRAADLRLFRDGIFDMVYTGRVLQHIPSRGPILLLISEFMRILADEGLLVFQLPTHIPFHHRIQPRRKLFNILRNLGFPKDLLYKRLGLDPIRMTAVPEQQVLSTLQDCNARILDSERDQLSGSHILSRTYYVTKRTDTQS